MSDVDNTDELSNPQKQLQHSGLLTGVGNVAAYQACPQRMCYYAKLLPDGHCRTCLSKPAVPASAYVCTLTIKNQDGTITPFKAFTPVLKSFYKTVKPDLQLTGTSDDIEEQLWQLLPIQVSYKFKETPNGFNFTALTTDDNTA